MHTLWKLPVVPIVILSLHLCDRLCTPTYAAATTTPGGSTFAAASACSRAAKHDPNVNMAFCAAALKQTWMASSSSSGHGNRRAMRPFPHTISGVAELSVLSALANATATKSAIHSLLRSGGRIAPEVGTTQCLKDCLVLYSTAAATLKDSMLAVREGRLQDASMWINSVMDTPGMCDDGFIDMAGRKGGGDGRRKWNPLRKNDNDLFMLTAMALNFVTFLRQQAV